jgi:hypothetical protein
VDAHGTPAAVFAERTPAAVLADGASFALLAGGAYLYISMHILYTHEHTQRHTPILSVYVYAPKHEDSVTLSLSFYTCILYVRGREKQRESVCVYSVCGYFVCLYI